MLRFCFGTTVNNSAYSIELVGSREKTWAKSHVFGRDIELLVSRAHTIISHDLYRAIARRLMLYFRVRLILYLHFRGWGEWLSARDTMRQTESAFEANRNRAPH